MAGMQLEVVSIPVSDQDRAKAFYVGQLGFTLLVDSPFGEGMRWVQLSPEDGAQTSITLVTWFEAMPPGCVQGMLLAVANIEETRALLVSRGVDVEPVYGTPWGKFANFKDPDGNGWGLHQR